MILRKWDFRVRSHDETAFVAYIEATGSAYALETDGNHGFQIIVRRHADGNSTVSTLSWWRDVEAVKGFAGEDYEKARYYPEDDKYLLERNEFVEHYDVAVDRR